MTTNPTPIPEPTSPTEVVVGKCHGKTVVAVQLDDDATPWAAKRPDGSYGWRTWSELCEELTDIRVVDVSEPRPTKARDCARCDRIEAHSLGNEALLARRREQLAKAKEEIDQLKARVAELENDKPEPGQWLRGDELEAVMSTLRAGYVAEMSRQGVTVSGTLKLASDGGLWLLGWVVRKPDGQPGFYVDALRIIERAPEPEPGADIPDEVVDAACAAWQAATGGFPDVMRAVLAATDAKRAELDGGVR